jgi:hypothetical protein
MEIKIRGVRVNGTSVLSGLLYCEQSRRVLLLILARRPIPRAGPKQTQLTGTGCFCQNPYQLSGELIDTYDLIANGVQDDLAHRMQMKFPHEVTAMRLRGLHAAAQHHRDFFRGLAFRN